MIGLYAGSFDPPHLGHLDIVRRAAALCARLVVAVAINPQKAPFLPVERRVAMLVACCADLPNVSIATYSGATALFARTTGATVLIRSLRTAVDAEFERQIGTVNRQVVGLETVLLMADAATSHLSSSLVREAARAGLPLTGLCPPALVAEISAAGHPG